MNSKYLSRLIFSALLLGCAIASAQSPDTPKGNEVTGNPQPPPANALSSPQTTGQDKSTGNNLVGPNTGQALASTTPTHPDFDSLDSGKKGYLTKHNVKGHKWLSKNFAKCDTDHDGHLSPDEFTNCHK
jgi:hypothetical protein